MCCSACLLKTVGSAFPFDVLSLSDSLSEIFEDGIGDIFFFSFIQSNLKGFQQYFSSPRCFVVLGGGWVGIQVGCSFPLGFLSLGNGTPGDLGKDVTDKIYIFMCLAC